MKHIDYWLDALPPEAPERELLAAAERDVPPPGSIDRSWNALCAAAAITSGAVAISGSAAASVSPAVAISGSAATSVSPALTSAVSASLATGASVTVLGNAAASASATALGSAAASAPLLAAGKGAILASSAAVSGAAASGAAASATTSAGLVGLSVAAKSIAIGFAIGVGALGTGQLVQSTHRSEPAPLASHSESSRHASRLRSAVHAAPRRVSAAQNEAAEAKQIESANRQPHELEPVKGQANQSEQANLDRANGHTNPLEPANGQVNRLERVNDSERGRLEHDGAPTSVAGLARKDSNQVNTADVRSANSAKSADGKSAKSADGKSASSKSEPRRSPQQQPDEVARKQSGVPSHLAEMPLSQQAAELARIKGLLDSGAPSEALVRLRACLDAHALSAIAEDRDALYIEALKRTGHHTDAKRAASNFYVRYPNSPQRDRIGDLVAGE